MNQKEESAIDFIQSFTAFAPATDATRRRALQTSLISLDANVLLNFYRYSPSTRHALAEVLSVLSDRLFVSHQAAVEFWRNRVSVIDDRDSAQTQLVEQVDKMSRSLEAAIAVWKKRTAATDETVAELIQAVHLSRDRVASLLEAEAGEDESIGYAIERDPVVEQLRHILNRGVMGGQPDSKRHEEMIEEGLRRVANEEPPGYLDADKSTHEEGAAGDYMVWRQTLDEAKHRGLPVVIVTGDEKDDWWWRHRGTVLGPRRELMHECRLETGQPPVFLRPTDLVRLADALNVSVDPAAAADIERASEPVREAAWTKEAAHELLARLDAETDPRAEVIRFAAVNGGYIKRSEVFLLCGYDEDRMLRGFTRPVRRITRSLIDDGLLPAEPVDVLIPDYGTGVVARGFFVPDEVVGLIQTA
ncbi:DUF4935 domain-containing protein [Phycicoccus sp. CSK15P-2]|uniref:PIN-like domain-containing protein n=1 Tax=Phycicoccus sp. CSK15P-2 TaxID=2807627 RepID=UPI001951091E|nr:PIN-like domain-containing protein [Phycicoccus sp. CSK15P-2]MBM6404623.1 DUF4935 domain-containing protein [Phycicoccus sp. CSK15P-2]